LLRRSPGEELADLKDGGAERARVFRDGTSEQPFDLIYGGL
jgi:hypothetical protein